MLNTLSRVFLTGFLAAKPLSCNLSTNPLTAKTIYEFSAKTIDGQEVSLEKYRLQLSNSYMVAVIQATVYIDHRRTGSIHPTNFCVFINPKLEELYQKYSESKGLRILAFPCNQFASQEPGTNEEIKDFVSKKYQVSFDMFSKIDVNGKSAHPLWIFLKKEQPGFLTDGIKWNLTKFLINKEGVPVKRYGPKTAPKVTLYTFLFCH
uniref:Glutathione peroxidase n=1 Tax=Octopus bimaculoides TaxID=37653 RepID=A0A0L8GSX8_OCTBM